MLVLLIIVVKGKRTFGCAIPRETKTICILSFKHFKSSNPIGHESRKNKVIEEGVQKSYFEINVISFFFFLLFLKFFF